MSREREAGPGPGAVLDLRLPVQQAEDPLAAARPSWTVLCTVAQALDGLYSISSAARKEKKVPGVE